MFVIPVKIYSLKRRKFKIISKNIEKSVAQFFTRYNRRERSSELHIIRNTGDFQTRALTFIKIVLPLFNFRTLYFCTRVFRRRHKVKTKTDSVHVYAALRVREQPVE